MPRKRKSAPHERSSRFNLWAKKQADDQSLKALATSLRALRRDRGMSGQDLAERVGCTLKNIYHIERAENWPSMSLYLALCREFRHSLIQLY